MPVAPDYVIGPDDVLSILFWRDKDLSAADVTVRPDGKVTLPLLNDVQASGRTPEAARRRDPRGGAQVRRGSEPDRDREGNQEPPRLHHRADREARPYPLNGRTTILQLIAMAGGLREFVDGKDISVMRNEKDKQTVFDFNYQDVVRSATSIRTSS